MKGMLTLALMGSYIVVRVEKITIVTIYTVTYQRLRINWLITTLLHAWYALMIYGRIYEYHCQNKRIVFEKIREANIKLSSNKKH